MPSIDKSFGMNHTCLRIRDPEVSIRFYRENFGLQVIATLPFPQSNFTLYMMAYPKEGEEEGSWTARQGVLELCHNYGSEGQKPFNFSEENGGKPRGFGHICVSVDNIEVAEEKLVDRQVTFKKRLADGRQKNIAFALDPDGYWIELIENGVGKVAGTTDPKNYRFNHTMIRVRDPQKSLDFYTKVLGMKVLSTSVHESAKFTLYFLGYEHSLDFTPESLTRDVQAKREGIIELTHNWGTENDSEFVGYHNGNSTENGAVQDYGHTCISCDDPTKFCHQVDQEFGDTIDWALRWNQGRMKGIGFIRDPDGYSIEIVSTTFKA